jgi:type VI secretion system protein ImpE
LEKLKMEVRKAPRDPRLRTFLFQLFCIFAEWDRALTQLTVASELDAAALPMAQTYRAAIRCEILRERIFAGARSPTFLGEPAPWMSLLVEANRVLATGAMDAAAGLRDAAFEAAPATAGSMDGKYYWVPFTRLARIDIEAPADLRDQVWMPAHFTWSTGGEGYGFIPTRYPGSAAAEENLALSRRTEWRETDDWVCGLGQRMLTTDADEVAIMDLRRLEFAPA